MSRKHLFLVIVTVALSVTLLLTPAIGFAGDSQTPGLSQEQSVSNELPPTVASELESELAKFIEQDSLLSYWEVLDQNIKTLSAKSSDKSVEAVFLVDRIFLLDYPTPEDVPVLMAKLTFLKANGHQLSPEGLAAAQREIEDRKQELQEYISVPRTCSTHLKITADLTDAGKVNPGTVRFYGELPNGDWTLLEDFSYIVPPQKVEEESVAGLRETIAMAEAEPQGDVGVTYVYDRIKARNYAQNYTSTASGNYCSGCNSGGTGCDQDKSKYNSSYQCWCCADCANFVSQAQNAGGMTPTSTWQPYTDAWVNVCAQEQYMKNTTGRWVATNHLNCVAGYPIVDPGSTCYYYHIVMMTYNDGSRFLYCGHTNDRRDEPWYFPSDARYYRVVNE